MNHPKYRKPTRRDIRRAIRTLKQLKIREARNGFNIETGFTVGRVY